jgi:ubiquinone/menaquinone biosynthesis C-methylase UbiE
MPPSNYDYRGLVASTWDVWRDNTANWSDRNYYLQIIKEFGQPVLDIGCGTGRLIVDFLQHGIDIDGIDSSPEMLEICRDKCAKLGFSVNLYCQTVQALSLPRRYRTILVPSSVLQLLPPDTAQIAVRKCFGLLEPGGALTGSFSFGWREGDPLDTGWILLFEKTRPSDGAIVKSWTHEWHTPAERSWHVEQRFEITLNGKVIADETYRRSPEGWWYTHEQAESLFRAGGFDDVRLFSEFSREPVREEDRLFTALVVRPLA